LSTQGPVGDSGIRDPTSKNRREFLRGALRASGIMLGCGLLPETTGFSRPARGQPPPIAGRTPGDERVVDGIRLCWCPPGQFLMGSPPGEVGRRRDEAQVQVTLTRGFWMGKLEVTQGEWTRVSGSFPDRRPSADFGLGDEFPVYWINFPEAEAFCRMLSEQARKSGSLPAGWEFRVPTEAQWEYACRAGTLTASAFGDSLGRNQANFSGEPLNGGPGGPALGRAARGGTYSPNRWGICDMHGNVFEWCRDWYHASLPGGTDPDLYEPRGVQNRDGTYSRVRRGGAWNDDGVMCRSAFRLRYEPERRSDHIGFRAALVQS
jgi:formylglycine-generating enzyme